MRVLFAGGTGVCGAPTVRRLREAGHEVTLLLRPIHRAAPAGLPVVIADATDADAVLAAVRAVRPDVVICQVSSFPVNPDGQRAGEQFRANDMIRTVSTVNLAAAARAVGARTIAASVAFWYVPGSGPATEDQPLWFEAHEPISRSVWAIAELETAVGIGDGIVLRVGILIGSGTHFARDGTVGVKIATARYPILGEGAGVTSFVHTEDVAGATVHALGIAPGLYNVVDDEPATESVWLPAMAAMFGGPPPSRVPTPAAGLFLNRGFVDWRTHSRGASNAKLRATGWTPIHPSWRTALFV
jgi:nucleoside-diphosphate-sugar epimerase